MKKILNRVVKFIKETNEFVCFLVALIIQGSFANPIKKKYSGTVAVLANGPSLKEVIPKLTTKEFENIDFIVMNFFALDDVFFKIKPKHYCLADPMFFKANHRIDDVSKLFNILQNKVDWKLNLYLPSIRYKEFIAFSKLNNDNIQIVKTNYVGFRGYEVFRNYFYKKGLSSLGLSSVALLAIYIGIQCGYNEEQLYGVDHTFFDNLFVNDKNQLYSKYSHFDTDKTVTTLSPLLRNDTDCFWRISDYIYQQSKIFKNHDISAKYAQYMNVLIINCTKNSLIDSYNRI
ncbi:hypothetical protein FACS1894181_01370 [Bacteroidia bacterium]|nr:hypothetical protein FACS1894181_01370 [Bacteroidia bacterium]